MAKTQRLINGAETVLNPISGHMTEAVRETVVPVKSQAELLAELDRLRAENQRLQSQPKTGLTLKISEKGALSVYGMGRFPFTLYVEQWEKLFAMADEIKAFMKANASRLSRKQ